MGNSELLAEVRTCLAHYIVAFNSYSTAQISKCYSIPCLIIRADGTLHALTSYAEIEKFFQPRLEQLQSEGCRDWRYTNLEAELVGGRSLLATMAWEPLRADGTAIATWRQTYQFLRTEEGLRFVVSTVHA